MKSATAASVAGAPPDIHLALPYYTAYKIWEAFPDVYRNNTGADPPGWKPIDFCCAAKARKPLHFEDSRYLGKLVGLGKPRFLLLRHMVCRETAAINPTFINYLCGSDVWLPCRLHLP